MGRENGAGWVGGWVKIKFVYLERDRKTYQS